MKMNSIKKKKPTLMDWLHLVTSKGETSNFLMEDLEQVKQLEIIDF